MTEMQDEAIHPTIATLPHASQEEHEMSQYDIWSDHELQQLNNFFPVDHPPQTDQPTSSSSPNTTAFPQIVPPSTLLTQKSSPELPPSISNEAQCLPALKNKRTHSSLFTTGAGNLIPMELEHEQLKNSGEEDWKVQDSSAELTDQTSHLRRKASIHCPESTNNSSNPPTQDPCPLPIFDSSQLPPPSSIIPPQRTVSSLFQTGAGRPYPLNNNLQEKGSGTAAEDEVCPVFGFQTGHGASVSAPSKESMKKALDFCTATFTSPFAKRPYKEPESPSPSHRAKIQKSSQVQAFESPSSSGIIPSSINEASTGAYNHHAEEIDATKPSVGLLSTGAGAPVKISASAIECSRAYLDDPSRSPVLKQTSANQVPSSPLKDVSNLQPNYSHKSLQSMKADLLAGSHQSDRPTSTTLAESIHAVASKVPSQPTTAASLMSTPIRPMNKMLPRTSLHKKASDELNWIPPTLPHMVTAPVRRISNRMHIGLTPQSSRRVSHEGKPVTESRPFVTPFKKNMAGINSTSKSAIPSNQSLYTPVRESTLHLEDDTPSSNQNRRRVMYMEPTHMFERQNSGALKPQSVYDLKSRMERRIIPMKTWLGPYKGYTARNLLSLAIPESVVFMTSRSSVVWTFNPLTDPFGSIHALDQLLKSGCLISRSTPTWVANHWSLIIWKLASLVRWRPDCFHRVWNPSYVVEQLKYRYEREFVHGHRSIVKRILDRDCPPNIPMCLVIVSIIRKESKASTLQEQLVELSDGWYKIKAVLDPVLTRALKRGALKVGFKIAIFGASTEMTANLKSYNSNHKSEKKKLMVKDPKNKQESESKNQEEEVEEEIKLYLEGNSTSRAKFDETLGFRANQRPWFASLKSLTSDGGKIPLMDLVVTKIFEPSFLDDGDRKIARQSWDLEVETKLRIAWENEREKELERIVNEERVKFEGIEELFNKISNLIYGMKSTSSPHHKHIKETHKKSERQDLSPDKTNEVDNDHVNLVAAEVASIHSQSSASQFDADEMCEELIEEHEENASNNVNSEENQEWISKMNQISSNKLMKLKAAFECKLESLKKNSIDLIQKKLDMRVPIRRTRKTQLLQVQDFHNHRSIGRDATKKSSPSIKVVATKSSSSAQLIVTDLSKLPDDFFKQGHRYWVQNIQPKSHTYWDSKSNTQSPPILLSTRRDSHWIHIGSSNDNTQ